MATQVITPELVDRLKRYTISHDECEINNFKNAHVYAKSHKEAVQKYFEYNGFKQLSIEERLENRKTGRYAYGEIHFLTVKGKTNYEHFYGEDGTEYFTPERSEKINYSFVVV